MIARLLAHRNTTAAGALLLVIGAATVLLALVQGGDVRAALEGQWDNFAIGYGLLFAADSAKVEAAVEAHPNPTAPAAPAA